MTKKGNSQSAEWGDTADAVEVTAPDVALTVSEYRPRLKSFIRQRVSNADDAEDILQDVLYQFARAAADVLNPIEQVGAWLYRVARNTIINRGKKKREAEMPYYKANDGDDDILRDFSEILFSGEAGSPSPETEYLRSLVWEELEKALSELPPEQREVFEKTEMEGFSAKEIAEMTGVGVNTLLSRKHYAVLHLRERLAQLYEELICS